MSDRYIEGVDGDADKFADVLRHLDSILASDKLQESYEQDATELRRDVKKMLINVNTDVSNLKEIESSDVFKTDPTLANRRYTLIKSVESAKVDFEFDILPKFEKLTIVVVQAVKRNPPASVDENKLPPLPGEQWTVDKVLNTTDQLLDQAKKAGGMLAKAYSLAKAVGLLIGIPLP